MSQVCACTSICEITNVIVFLLRNVMYTYNTSNPRICSSVKQDTTTCDLISHSMSDSLKFKKINYMHITYVQGYHNSVSKEKANARTQLHATMFLMTTFRSCLDLHQVRVFEKVETKLYL